MNTDNFAAVQPCLDSLLRTLLSSEKHSEVADDKKRILINMISRLPLETVENRTNQILVGICRQGGANANQIARAMMQRMPAAAVVGRLISEEFLHARSSRVSDKLNRGQSYYSEPSFIHCITVPRKLPPDRHVRLDDISEQLLRHVQLYRSDGTRSPRHQKASATRSPRCPCCTGSDQLPEIGPRGDTESGG